MWDAFSTHISDISKRVKRSNSDLAVIPGGLTTVVQPLDVCLRRCSG